MLKEVTDDELETATAVTTTKKKVGKASKSKPVTAEVCDHHPTTH